MEFYKWHQRIGATWAELLQFHALESKSTVVEVGPGFTSKIGIALAQIEFRGRLFIVEPNKDALNWIENQYKKILPNAEIVPINRAIKDAAPLIPINVNAVLMNHVLDDMILNARLTNYSAQNIFGQMRPEHICHPLVQKTWCFILNDPNAIESLSKQVLCELCIFLSEVNPQLFATSQYHSWFLRKHELEKVNLLGLKLLNDLRGLAGDTHVKFDSILKNHAHSPRHWLLIERDSNEEIFSKLLSRTKDNSMYRNSYTET